MTKIGMPQESKKKNNLYTLKDFVKIDFYNFAGNNS